MKQHKIKPRRDDIKPKHKPTHSVVYCKRSGVRFEIIDNFGLNYLADSNTVHPIFLDRASLRALLKLEYAKARQKPERLYDDDWQDITAGSATDYQYKTEDQMLSKSFIAGVVLAQLAELNLITCKELTGKHIHKLNIALCKHRARANLIWMARQLLMYPADNSAMRINLDTVYNEYKGWHHETKHWSDAIGSYIEAMLEDEEDRLPKLKSYKKTSIAVYDSNLPRRKRLRNIDKPLNGTRVNAVLKHSIKILGKLKQAKLITKRKETQISTAIMNWPQLSETGLITLGDRLVEYSEHTVLSDDEQQILYKTGLAFNTGEIKLVGNPANYTLHDTFLGEVQEESEPEQQPSLADKLRAKVKNHESSR